MKLPRLTRPQVVVASGLVVVAGCRSRPCDALADVGSTDRPRAGLGIRGPVVGVGAWGVLHLSTARPRDHETTSPIGPGGRAHGQAEVWVRGALSCWRFAFSRCVWVASWGANWIPRKGMLFSSKFVDRAPGCPQEHSGRIGTGSVGSAGAGAPEQLFRGGRISLVRVASVLCWLAAFDN